MSQATIYIAGPMRGYKFYNFPAFDAAEGRLIVAGYKVVNPAAIDRSIGSDPMKLPVDTDWNAAPPDFNIVDCAKRDLTALQSCAEVYMLDGWQKSKGALAEKAVAEFMGLIVSYQTPPTSEVRMKDLTTGGEKGVKAERFDLIPVWPLEEVARAYGYGLSKYGESNWMKGYKWGYSYGACQRHLNAFWRGEDHDKESGLMHLAHAAWHCLALMWFHKYSVGTDDRLVAKGKV